MQKLEREAKKKGYRRIAGVDEAGRGPLAGPVVAAACRLPEGLCIEGMDDSKKVPPPQRQKLFEVLTRHEEVAYGIGIIDAATIDQVNILQATILAMLQAVEKIETDYLLVDGLQLPHPTLPVQRVVSGDALSQVIAAASILAKVTRDALMEKFHQEWPEYGFRQHKGYGTAQHYRALAKYGPSPIHRRSFNLRAVPCCEA